jgi:hypothetical protein
VIRCEHCGSALPDGAIFCGECGRAVTTSAARRTAPVEPVDRATPPPLQQPDAHGRAPETADDAWLPESTLDPATRAWLTGADRSRPTPGPDAPDLTPRSAPTHVHGAGTGLGDWTGSPAAPRTPAGAPTPAEPTQAEPTRAAPTRAEATLAEPTLDPDAFPSEDVAPQDDPEVQRTAGWAPAGADSDRPAASAAPGWEPQATPDAPPAGPSWWIGRSPSAAVTDSSTSTDTPADADRSVDDAPRPGDTAAFQPVVERRAPRPAPLVAPGSQSATCHVCGHTLEPDDIFCEECGSVRPAVTAAFTGPVMPLPLTRPDWAADEEALRSAVSDAHELTDERAGDTEAGGDAGADESVAEEPVADQPADHEPADDERADDEPVPDVRSADEPAVDESAGQTEPDEPAAADPALDVSAADAAHDAGSGSGPEQGSREPAGQDGTDTEQDRSETGHDRSTDGLEARIPSAAPLPPVSAPVRDTPTAAPLPPVRGTPTAAPLPPVQHEDEDEDVEATRIVSRTAEHAPFLLHFSTGERLGVHGSALLGRLPRPEADERFDDLLTIRDPGKSVSKTHLELGRDGDDLWVSDRYSGNGTVIRHIDGSIRRCEPGRRYRVERGARVDVGEQFFLLQ